VYRSSRKLYHEADSQGMRVYHDELIMGDVRMVMLGTYQLVLSAAAAQVLLCHTREQQAQCS
jgi:hypothetical protein